MNGTPFGRPPPGERVCDLLDDPITQMVMRRDGVTREDILAVLAQARDRVFQGTALAVRFAA